MRNKRLVAVVFMACLLCVFACEKYEGTISGNVVYVEEGISDVAVNAVITKIEVKGERETVVAKEKTDTLGNYALEYTTTGSWKVTGRLEIDSLVYEGVSEVVKIDETNKTARLNLVLTRK